MISRFNRSSTTAGVPAGANTPNNEVMLACGRPSSAKVGTPGKTARRSGEPTAKGLKRPASIWRSCAGAARPDDSHAAQPHRRVDCGRDNSPSRTRRVEALSALLSSEDGKNLLAGYKRAANILKKEDWHGVEGHQRQRPRGALPARPVVLGRVEEGAAVGPAGAVVAQDAPGDPAEVAALRERLSGLIERFEPRPGQSTRDAVAELRDEFDLRIDDRVAVTVDQVVEHHDLAPLRGKQAHGMRADVAGPAADQDRQRRWRTRPGG